MSRARSVASRLTGSRPQKCSILISCTRVITGASLNLVILLALDFELAVAAVQLAVRRSIANVVLAPKLVCDLVKSFLELLELVAHIDHPPAGLLGEPLHLSLAEIAHPRRSIKAAIGA